jgi:hypothetical protein
MQDRAESRAGLALLTMALLASGCATSALQESRTLFYRGDFTGSAQVLSSAEASTTDLVLVLMERATARQSAADYEGSIHDWARASTLADQLDIFSVSRESASMVVNDNLLAYRGAPYERVLLHAFAAQSYLALGMWQDAAVEGRNIIRRVEDRGDYPDDPYSRYVAALSLELARDPEGAAFQYAQAARLAKRCSVDPATGRLGPPPPIAASTNEADAPPAVEFPPPTPGPEFICLVGFGRGPTGGYSASSNWRWGGAPYAEFYAGGQLLGRSYTLMTTDELFHATEKVTQLRTAAKTAARIALKETAAQIVSQENEALGDLLRLILFAMETDDRRAWETLPAWLGAARVPCPPNVDRIEVVFKTGGGDIVEHRVITRPLARLDGDTVSFVRAL